MRIVHVSDVHGRLPVRLPAADVYVWTGDILPTFCDVLFRNRFSRDVVRWRPNAHLVGETSIYPMQHFESVGREVLPSEEARCQRLWMQKVGSVRSVFGSPDAPVVHVRGNHDFTSLAPLFEGGPAFEVGEDPTVVHEVMGLRFGGMRGINFIAGEWSDELGDEELSRRAERLPMDLDVLVTHAPPYGVLDEVGTDRIGVRAFEYYVDRRGSEDSGPTLGLRAHLFGHCHERGMQTQAGPWGVKFSNAAQGYNVLEV